MGCHTWFYRPALEGEEPSDDCQFSEDTFGEDRYVEVPELHDLFRVNGYPEDQIQSFYDAVRFCKSKGIELREGQVGRMRDFWRENPFGVVEFG
jgi:hypothetical protein